MRVARSCDPKHRTTPGTTCAPRQRAMSEHAPPRTPPSLSAGTLRAQSASTLRAQSASTLHAQSGWPRTHLGATGYRRGRGTGKGGGGGRGGVQTSRPKSSADMRWPSLSMGAIAAVPPPPNSTALSSSGSTWPRAAAQGHVTSIRAPRRRVT
jgi:hypothetical protein